MKFANQCCYRRWEWVWPFLFSLISKKPSEVVVRKPRKAGQQPASERPRDRQSQRPRIIRNDPTLPNAWSPYFLELGGVVERRVVDETAAYVVRGRQLYHAYWAPSGCRKGSVGVISRVVMTPQRTGSSSLTIIVVCGYHAMGHDSRMEGWEACTCLSIHSLIRSGQYASSSPDF